MSRAIAPISTTQAILFGGVAGTTYTNSQYLWDHAAGTWTLQSPTRPSARAYHRMVWDSYRNVVVLFGGMHFFFFHQGFARRRFAGGLDFDGLGHRCHLHNRLGGFAGAAFARHAFVVFQRLAQQHIELAFGLLRRLGDELLFQIGLRFLQRQWRNVNGDDQLGQVIDLTARDDEHVWAVLGHRFFVGGACIAGEDSCAFHVSSLCVVDRYSCHRALASTVWITFTAWSSGISL